MGHLSMQKVQLCIVTATKKLRFQLPKHLSKNLLLRASCHPCFKYPQTCNLWQRVSSPYTNISTYGLISLSNNQGGIIFNNKKCHFIICKSMSFYGKKKKESQGMKTKMKNFVTYRLT